MWSFQFYEQKYMVHDVLEVVLTYVVMIFMWTLPFFPCQFSDLNA